MGSLRQIREVRRPVIREADAVPSSISRENEASGFHSQYVNPDWLYLKPGAVAFIYTTDGRVFYGDESTTHYAIIGNHSELLDDRYGLRSYYISQGLPFNESVNSNAEAVEADSDVTAPRLASDPVWDSERDDSGNGWSDYDGLQPRDVALRVGDLLGRIGRGGSFVSFWNEDPENYSSDNLLQQCLQKLIADGHLKPDAEVSTPTHGTIPMREAMGGAKGRALTPEEQEQMELYKKLHLMRGQEKHDAMKKLGVGGGGKPHPMTASLDKAGLRTPGQRWWAMNSESFDRRLQSVLDRL